MWQQIVSLGGMQSKGQWNRIVYFAFLEKEKLQTGVSSSRGWNDSATSAAVEGCPRPVAKLKFTEKPVKSWSYLHSEGGQPVNQINATDK